MIGGTETGDQISSIYFTQNPGDMTNIMSKTTLLSELNLDSTQEESMKTMDNTKSQANEGSVDIFHLEDCDIPEGMEN